MNRKIQRLSNLRNRYYMVLDIFLLMSMPAIALFIRVEGLDPALERLNALIMFTVFITCVKMFVFMKFGLYRHYWAYASSEELMTLIHVISLAFLAEQILSYGFLFPVGFLPWNFPRSLPFLDGILSAVAISGTRVGVRLLFSVAKKREFKGEVRHVLIAGAGVAGTMIARELLANPHLGLVPAGYLDDNSTKIGKLINGVRVLGPLSKLPEIVKSRSIAEVIIAMPTAPGDVIRKVVRLCRSSGVVSKTVPGLFEIVDGTAQVQKIRPVRLDDLLRRGAIRTDTSQVADVFRSARVMVTGAGGSIGSELCRQVMTFKPAEIILIGHGENSIFTIERELRALRLPGIAIHPIIADIRDKDRLGQVFMKYQPEVIFHAAAHKHVWLMEQNACDAVTNNVLGTRNLVQLAEEHRVSRLVMISTDKAVNPTSIMGVTKRIAEFVVRDAVSGSSCAFITVRFGNVLGSRGSVVPIFEQQIRAGGPITVTHPDVKRFFMTIPEAVQLVLQAGAMGKGGEVFVLDMGDQIRVADIARDLLRLHGLEEEKDIRIEFTGLMRGEKLYEELFYQDEKVLRTGHEKVLVARNGDSPESVIASGIELAHQHNLPPREGVNALIAAAQEGKEDLVNQLFSRLVPQFAPAETTQGAVLQVPPAIPASAPARSVENVEERGQTSPALPKGTEVKL